MRRALFASRKFVVVVAVFGIVLACQASELVITSFKGSGQLVFNEIPDAVGYRIEWAADPNGPWYDFTWSAVHGLDFINATGSGSLTNTVPMFYRVVALTPDRSALPMANIPGDTFTRGDLHNEWEASRPAHTVTLDSFRIAATPVTIGQWLVAYNWALNNGYDIEPLTGGGGPGNHPVSSVSWYDAVKWCNARSEMEGLIPCYTVDGDVVYKTGQRDDVVCDWDADGYRLPTDAEWEWAARGGTTSRFPWGERISHSNANYYASCTNGAFTFPYDDGPCGRPPEYGNKWPPTSPVHAYAPNTYGLYDVIGNVAEWVWDWHAPYTADDKNNPRGPDEFHIIPVRTVRSGPFPPPIVAWRGPLPPAAALIGSHGFRPARKAAE